MNNLIKAELYKLKHDRSFWAIALTIILIGILAPSEMLIRGTSGEMKGIDVVIAFVNQNELVMKYAPCILAGFFISSDYSTGVMKNLISGGNKRMEIVLAKLSVFTIGAIIISILFPLVLWIVSTVFFGSGSHLFPNMSVVESIVPMIGLLALYGAAFASFMTLIGLIFTDSGKTISFLFVFTFGLEVAFSIFSKNSPIIQTIYDHSIIKLIKDIPAAILEQTELFTMIIVPILTFAVCAIGCCIVFSRKEIK
ncbi:ABC transporter permease [Peribacillus frigoritolerans]|uniref:ABC transporter permease n=1 Tax=Peribacillus frigoritolerans TaxID=450367 RepID=UPI000D03E4C3|nr:ABC transporter permease [Peribacillus frigoritolerans]MED3759618.1 ABC transporter permease [Peribacillus frigoritolerans]PRS44443.1 ABC transporter permease [Bacillus sp. RJGP41]UYY97781.1 ABC transporter permease [Peribacillus frigoritolerans]WHY12934.1 ABC transporter permease [Peribacillus frigoritolerans]